MKKILAVVALSLSALMLAGCVSDETATEVTRVINKDLDDGRTVTCVFYNSLSCDWENAR